MRILCLLLLLLPASLFAQEETLIFNANIFTANVEHPFADAVAIRGDKIVAVGNYEEVSKTVTSAAKKIDLGGGCLLPGLVDSHIHAIKGGNTLLHPNVFDELLSTPQLAEYTRKVLATKDQLVDGIVLIYGLNIASWMQLNEIDSTFNSPEFVNHPIWLRGSDGHTAWANKAMLVKAGVDRSYIQSLTSDQRQYFGIRPSMEPNGFAADSALEKFFTIVPANSIDYQQASLKTMDYCAGNGITAWLEVSAAYTDDKQTPILDAYQWLASQHKLTGHIAATIVADADGDAQNQINTVKAWQKKYKQSVSILGFKVFADGVVEYPTQTASLSQPYVNHSGFSGVLMYNPRKFARFATIADKQGLLVHVHAIGDRAVTETLNGFEAARKANGFSILPHTITHMQFVLPTDFDRFKKLNVLASLQLLWAYGDITTIDIIRPYISPSIYKWQYPARSLLHAGATICGASDWPVSSANPFEAMSRAESRKGLKGVLDSTQCMPRMAMLYAYTINAAKALMMEKKIGSIEAGKYADLVFVDRDVLTVGADALNDCKVLWTMFEGKIVYKANP